MSDEKKKPVRDAEFSETTRKPHDRDAGILRLLQQDEAPVTGKPKESPPNNEKKGG